MLLVKQCEDCHVKRIDSSAESSCGGSTVSANTNSTAGVVNTTTATTTGSTETSTSATATSTTATATTATATETLTATATTTSATTTTTTTTITLPPPPWGYSSLLGNSSLILQGSDATRAAAFLPQQIEEVLGSAADAEAVCPADTCRFNDEGLAVHQKDLNPCYRPGTCIGTGVLSTGICEDYISGTTNCPAGFVKCASLFKTYFPADTTVWKLLWRGTRDGFAGSEFHNRCDYQGATVTVVKSESGYVFGAVTGVNWASRGGVINVNGMVDTRYSCSTSLCSFLFGIRTHGSPDAAVIFKPTKHTQQAMYDSPKFGPSFTGLMIHGNANANVHSTSHLGDTYTGNGITSGTDTSKKYFAGADNFKVAEIEVFKLV